MYGGDNIDFGFRNIPYPILFSKIIHGAFRHIILARPSKLNSDTRQVGLFTDVSERCIKRDERNKIPYITRCAIITSNRWVDMKRPQYFSKR